MKRTNDNKIALTLDSNAMGDALLRQPIPETRRQKRECANAVKRMWLDNKLGFNPFLCCWCGARMEIDYFKYGVDAMTERFNEFCEMHEGCEPPWEEVSV
jgi:hypothetical protein